MGNLTENRIDTVLTEAVITEINDSIIAIEDQLPGAGIIPAFIKPVHIKNDFTLFEQLDAIESNMTNVLRRISDLKRIAGSEAYDYSLTVYRIYESANLAGIPGAKESYDKLKVRFESQNAGAGRPTPTA